MGIAVSDTARLHLYWEDLGERVERVPVKIEDDLNVTDALSSFSGGITVVSEKKKDEQTTEKVRKRSTAAWIEAQRRPGTSRSTTRVASTTTNYRHSKLPSLSGFDTHSSVPSISTRALRDAEYLATLTPLPPSSIADSIEIGVHPPSSISRFSSPTVKNVPELPVHQIAPDDTDVRQRPSYRPRTPKATVETVSSSDDTEMQPIPLVSQPHERHSPRPAVEELPTSQIPEEREFSVHAPSAYQSPSHRRAASSQRQATVQPEVVEVHSEDNQQSYPTPSFAYHFPHLPAPSQSARSVHSTRMTTRPAADLGTAFIDGMREQAGSMFSRRPASRAGVASVRGDDPLPVPMYASKSPRSERVPLDSPHSKREIIVNYTEGSTQIYIPPPPSSGKNVREASHFDHSEGLQLQTHVDVPVTGHQSPSSAQSMTEEISVVSKSKTSIKDRSRPKSMSIRSYPDLETVPSTDHEKLGIKAEKPSRSTSGEISSETQPPSSFHLRTAWRDSIPPPSPSLEYSGHIIEDDDAIFDPGADIIERESKGRSTGSRPSHTRRMSESSSSRLPSLKARSRSIASAHTRMPHIETTDVDSVSKCDLKSPALVETDQPSTEWFPPGLRQPSTSYQPERLYNNTIDNLSSDSYKHSNHQGSAIQSPPTTSSALSRGTNAELTTSSSKSRTDARYIQTQIKELKIQRHQAQNDNKHTDIVALDHEIQTLSERLRKLNRKTDRRH